ncbi:hypothetical protein [Actinoplanes rectilineatus]|uniref:hypothetical protein n=1 Tax=Actinoplanes rectilineatus TaxID=113571 RepID=UPI0005F2D468|nr:hypothetical protein [Actinoplanes rectilineatus]
MLTDVDLPAPGLLWTRWATLSATLTAIGHTGVWSIDDRGARLDDPSGGWARFALLDGRRAVLYGHHREHSATARTDPPLDLLTGAPDWLPWDELTPLHLGFMIWHESGRWSRVRYRDGLQDGMTALLGTLLTGDATAAALAGVVTDRRDLLEADRREEVRAAGERLLHAAVRTEIAAVHLQDLLDHLTLTSSDDAYSLKLNISGALQVAASGGLTPGSRAPRIAPGSRPPMRRVRRLSNGEHDRLVWSAMHDATELRRPSPPTTAELDALLAWLRERSPGKDGRCTLLAYADATSFSTQPGDAPPADHPGEERFTAFRRMTELVRNLRRAESDPRYGRWLFLRVETGPTGVQVERRYDSWPPWWHDDGVSGPWRTNLQDEMDARHLSWRPDWAPLLDPEVAYKPTS